VLDCLRPCRGRVDEAERRADDSVERAQESAGKANRRLGAMRIMIETADQAEDFFERERPAAPGKPGGHADGR
jgi:hypothetical protein